MPNIALVDADCLTYRSGFAAQKTSIVLLDGHTVFGMYENITEAKLMVGEDTFKYLTVEEQVTADPVEHCLHTVKMQLAKIKEATKVSEMRLFLTGGDSFRERIAKTRPYKGNRDRASRPVHYEAIRNYLEKFHGAVTVDTIEADDALCMEQLAHFSETYDWSQKHVQKVLLDNQETIIVSLDKDLDMVPGWHYNFVNNDIYWADPFGKLWWEDKGTAAKPYKKLRGTGLKWFYAQLIMGDATDNIQGIPKKGPRAAYDVLVDCTDEREMYLIVRDLYQKAYGTAFLEVLWEMGNLLWLRRDLYEPWELLE